MQINKYIDHTLLKADAQKEDIKKLCEEAKEYNFYAVCVNGYWVKDCYEILKDTDVKVAAVVGFPLGQMTTEAKAFETKKAIEDGATEIDMVINIGELKAKNYDAVKKDIEEVVKAANENIVKVIIETCYLNDEEKIKACELSKAAGAHFVKTSTGFGTSGATVEDVKLMKQTVGDNLKVKASGGVRDLEGAKSMIDAGAERIGASSGIKIIEEWNKNS
ncbi:MAG: deoxyribose-phosphate aldolase [Tissierellia bacterium]|nr:deoxyribose-phosphate aldolase [Tissierellia bacterium]